MFHVALQTLEIVDPAAQLAELMAAYPCYAYVRNAERTGAKAIFRGRWEWEVVSEQLAGQATHWVMDDERASGYMRFRAYGNAEGIPGCLAEIELYFARGNGRTSFWCEASDDAASMGLVA